MRTENQPTQDQLNKLVEKHGWENQMNRSKGLDSWSNYGGENLGNLVVVVGRNRDSGILDESNFQAALEILGGESDSVQVHRFGHWGCGWFELILVDPKDRTKLIEAYNIIKALEHYPVLDDMDYSEGEWEYRSNYAEESKESLAEAIAVHFGIDLENHDKTLRKCLESLAFTLNMECQSHYGNDSCVYIYECREPDDRDLDRLYKCLNEVESNIYYSETAEESPIVALIEYLKACIGPAIGKDEK